MATSILAQYGTNGQTISCSIASLANNGQRESDAIDNTSNSFLDSYVMVKVKTGGSSVASTGTVNIYAFGTVDNGTSYSGGATGVNAGITAGASPNMPLIGVISASVAGTTYVGGPFSIGQAFGGVVPAKWGIMIENKTGAVLDSTEGNHAKLYQGIAAENI